MKLSKMQRISSILSNCIELCPNPYLAREALCALGCDLIQANGLVTEWFNMPLEFRNLAKDSEVYPWILKVMLENTHEKTNGLKVEGIWE